MEQKTLSFEEEKITDSHIIEVLDAFLLKDSTIGRANFDGLITENRFVIITPELADMLLKYNTKNRRFKNEHINKLTRQMVNGHWEYNGETIKFGYDGIMLDGQNRLQSVINSKKSVLFLVITGLDPESYHTIDLNSNRTIGDSAYIDGIPNSTITAAVVKSIFAYSNQRWSSNISANRTLSPTEFKEIYYTDESNYLDSINFGINLHKKGSKVLKAAELGTFHYLFGKKDKELASKFLHKLYVGDNLGSDSVILLLRNKLTNPNQKLANKAKVQFIIYAWNLIRQDKKVKKLIVPENFDGIIK
jgi:hypothetical protein